MLRRLSASTLATLAAIVFTIACVGGWYVYSARSVSPVVETADGGYTVRSIVGGEPVRLDLPRSREPIGLALWFHGQNGRVDTRMNEDWLNGLRAEGWAVASGDLAGNAWGNRDAIDAAGSLAQWASREAGRPVTLLVAGSMGALTSLNALTQGVISVGCWYGTMPVLDQNAAGSVPNAREEIATAFGGPVPDAFIPARATLPPIRYRVLASPADTWVPKVRHADVLSKRIAPGGTVTTLDVRGEHGDPSHFNADDLASFARNCR